MRWKKPDGTLVETNDFKGTIEGAKALGWVPEDAPKKRGRPPKNPPEEKEEAPE